MEDPDRRKLEDVPSVKSDPAKVEFFSESSVVQNE